MNEEVRIYKITISSDDEPATVSYHIAAKDFVAAQERAELLCKECGLVDVKRISKIEEVIAELS